MALQLSPELVNRINDLVAEGDYPDADTLLDQALLLLEERRDEEHLRGLLKVGIDQMNRGEVIPYTPEIFREASERARQRFANGERPSPDVCP